MLSETVSLPQLVGAGLVLAGVMLVARRSRAPYGYVHEAKVTSAKA